MTIATQAECPPIQMEPVDLSVNRNGVGRAVILTDTRHPSPTNGIDLRVNKPSKFLLLLFQKKKKKKKTCCHLPLDTSSPMLR